MVHADILKLSLAEIMKSHVGPETTSFNRHVTGSIHCRSQTVLMGRKLINQRGAEVDRRNNRGIDDPTIINLLYLVGKDKTCNFV